MIFLVGLVLQSFAASLPGTIAQGLIWGIMALGVFLTFKVLDFADLTVDSSLCTGGGVSAVLITKGVNPILALLLSLLAGMLAGVITGFLNTKLKIPAILAGILTQLGLYSINLHIMGRPNLSLLGQPVMVSMGNNKQAILIGVLICAALIAIMYWFFGTELGNAVRATGNNEKMARAMSINTDTMKVLCLLLSNGLVALAGGVLAQYQGYADVNMGRGAIVIGLASVIVGEVLLGHFSNFAIRCLSTIVGSVVYYIIIAFVIQLGLPSEDLKLLSAIVVAVALAFPSLRKKGKKNKKNKKSAQPVDLAKKGR